MVNRHIRHSVDCVSVDGLYELIFLIVQLAHEILEVLVCVVQA